MQYKITDLLAIMEKLRDPDTGCPWDVQQNFSTIAPYTIEEAYEVADAIQRGELGELQDELGDLLLQVVFHAQMATEMSAFSFDDIVASICQKMIRRHPHVFGGHAVENLEQQTQAWEDAKELERKQNGDLSLMDGIPRGMAELQRAIKLQKRAARAGFDWAAPGPVFDKMQEEINELLEAMVIGDDDQVEDELGDILFAVTNLARQLKHDPARALRRANAKFERRFRALEQAAGSRERLDLMKLEDMELLWQKVKLTTAQEVSNE